MSHVAKLFTTGGSQAVRLPAGYRFQGTEVHIRRDEATGDVILSSSPRMSWRNFMRLRDGEPVPEAGSFLLDREQPPHEDDRDVFAS